MTNLIDRLSTLTKPDRSLDIEIYQAAIEPLAAPFKQYQGMIWVEAERGIIVPRYTESIDDAMTLIPKGYEWTLTSDNVATICKDWDEDHAPVFWSQPPDKQHTSWSSAKGTVANPAIALTIACLKAREIK